MKITKKMTLSKVIQKHPETADVFMKNGLHCIGCMMGSFETIEQGAKAHNINVNNLMKELNKAIKNGKADNK